MKERIASINILEEIEKRSNYYLPLDNSIDPAYSGFIGKNDTEVLIMPERFFRDAYSKVPEAISGYSIAGIFDLGECYSPYVDLRFSLYLLQKDNHSQFISSIYNDSLYVENKPKGYNARNTTNAMYFSMPAEYRETFMYYLIDLETWLNVGIRPKDSFYACYNEINNSEFNPSEPFSTRYSQNSILVHDKLSKEKLVFLSDLAEIIEPSEDDITDEPVKYLWNHAEFEYPLKDSYYRTGKVMNFRLKKGDILLCSGGEGYQINYVPDERPEEIYCPALTTVVRAKEGVSPDYLFLYLRSDTGRTIMGDKHRSSVIKYLTPKEISKIPIIVPKRSAKSYRKLFDEIFIAQQHLNIFSDCFNKQDTDTIEGLLNDELTQKALRCRNKLVKDIIDNDLKEVKACFDAGAYKATLIMAGSVLEAFLIDWLSELHCKDYFSKNIYTSNGQKADLIDIINMIEEIKAPDWMEAADNAHTIREKRNLVHAKLCLKESVKIDAKLCEKVVRYLSQIIETRYQRIRCH